MNPYEIAYREAEAQNVPYSLVKNVIRAESGGKPGAVSNKGARGFMQLMPATAKELGVDINDPADNIRGGVTYLSRMLKEFNGDTRLALAAYNAGAGNVRKHGGVPPFKETQNYVDKITRWMEEDEDRASSNRRSFAINALPAMAESRSLINLPETRPYGRLRDSVQNGKIQNILSVIAPGTPTRRIPTAAQQRKNGSDMLSDIVAFATGSRNASAQENFDNAPLDNSDIFVDMPGSGNPQQAVLGSPSTKSVVRKTLNDYPVDNSDIFIDIPPQTQAQPIASSAQATRSGTTNTAGNGLNVLDGLARLAARGAERLAPSGSSAESFLRGEVKKLGAENYGFSNLWDDVKNSPIGGGVRGFRDIIDGAAQVAARGAESMSPAGSSAERLLRRLREDTENANEIAEKDYQQNWRRGGMSGIDAGRIGGQVLPFILAETLSGGGATPMLAPALARSATPSLLRSMGYGTVVSGLNPVYKDEKREKDYAQEKLSQMSLGTVFGAGGHGVGTALGHIVKPVMNMLPEGRKIGEAAAQRLGVKLSPGEKTNNFLLRQFEEWLGRTPGASRQMQNFYQQNQLAMNRAAASSIGGHGDTLSESVLGAAAARLKNEFNSTAAKTTLKLGDDFLNSLIKVEGINRNLNAFSDKGITKLIDDGLELAVSGKLSGQEYQALRSRFSEQKRKAFIAGDTSLGRAFAELQKGLDNAAKKGMDAETRIAWELIKKQYDSLKTLMKPNVVSAGNVNPARLSSELQRKHGDAYKTGVVQGELPDVARYWEGFKPIVPNSGTAERALFNQIFFNGGVTGAPGGAIAGLIQRALFSPFGQKYITNGLLPFRPPLAQAGGLLGGAEAGAYQAGR